MPQIFPMIRMSGPIRRFLSAGATPARFLTMLAGRSHPLLELESSGRIPGSLLFRLPRVDVWPELLGLLGDGRRKRPEAIDRASSPASLFPLAAEGRSGKAADRSRSAEWGVGREAALGTPDLAAVASSTVNLAGPPPTRRRLSRAELFSLSGTRGGRQPFSEGSPGRLLSTSSKPVARRTSVELTAAGVASSMLVDRISWKAADQAGTAPARSGGGLSPSRPARRERASFNRGGLAPSSGVGGSGGGSGPSRSASASGPAEIGKLASRGDRLSGVAFSRVLRQAFRQTIPRSESPALRAGWMPSWPRSNGPERPPEKAPGGESAKSDHAVRLPWSEIPPRYDPNTTERDLSRGAGSRRTAAAALKDLAGPGPVASPTAAAVVVERVDPAAAPPAVHNTFNVSVHTSAGADDGAELADRIRRILVDQARRHGVDVL